MLDDGTIADALGTLTDFESPHERCSVTDFPPCEPGVMNVWSATVDWGEFDNTGIAGATGHSITLLASHAAPVPEPSTLLLLGTGPFRIDTSERVSDSSDVCSSGHRLRFRERSEHSFRRFSFPTLGNSPARILLLKRVNLAFCTGPVLHRFGHIEPRNSSDFGT